MEVSVGVMLSGFVVAVVDVSAMVFGYDFEFNSSLNFFSS